jgi:hypothetical protein
MVRERNAVLLLHAKDADREPPDGARDPIAIGVERRVVGRADVGDHVHFHAVDDVMEIFAPQAEILDRRSEPPRARDRLARVERVDVGAPAVELTSTWVARTARVRNVVDLPAKGIDLEHGFALRARQYAHRIVERAARRPLGRRRV